MTVYATRADLVAFTGVDPGQAQAERLLRRASELMDHTVVVPFLDGDGNYLDLDNGQSDYQDSLRDAVCAQVEFWFEVGEEHDIGGQRGEISIEKLRIGRLPDTVADRAKRALARSGLLSRSVASGPTRRHGFFDNN